MDTPDNQPENQLPTGDDIPPEPVLTEPVLDQHTPEQHDSDASQKRIYILLALGLLLLGLVAAGVVWWLVASSKPKKKKAKIAEEELPKKPNLNATLLKLENTILGISTDGSEGKVQVEVVLVLASPELNSQVKPWMPEIEANIQRYLASLTSEQLKDTDFRNEQREQLRGILNKKIRTTVDEPIIEVLYHNYVFVL